MNKQEILKPFVKEEDKLLIAKVLDKWEMTQTRNKMTNTDFLDDYQQRLVQKALAKLKIANAILKGGAEEAERKMVVFYPEKWNADMIEKNENNSMCMIEILLPNELQGSYSHRNYLGGLMKLGIKREKIGDIITFKEGANIILVNEIAEYTKNSLAELTRFSKASIQIKNIKELHPIELKIEEMLITVSSLRIDNIVAELAKTSRTKAEEIICQQRVFLKGELVEKETKLVKQGDKITIRGKGRFVIQEILGNTKKGKYRIMVQKYQ